MILKLQEWIYTKLNIDKITKNITGIYYQVPSNSKFPYLYIGDFHSRDKSTKDQNIEDINFKLIIYLRDKSLKNMLMLAQEIKKTLQSEHEILLYNVEEKIQLQNDGITHQIAMQFKAIIGEKNDI